MTPRRTAPPSRPPRRFAQRGACQDLTHTFIAAARGAVVPARYVSGYFARRATARERGDRRRRARLGRGLCGRSRLGRVRSRQRHMHGRSPCAGCGRASTISARRRCAAPAMAAAKRRWSPDPRRRAGPGKRKTEPGPRLGSGWTSAYRSTSETRRMRCMIGAATQKPAHRVSGDGRPVLRLDRRPGSSRPGGHALPSTPGPTDDLLRAAFSFATAS